MSEDNTKKPRSRTGPRPKTLKTGTYTGIEVGRDKKIIDPQEVYKLAQIGCKDNEIADWFDIDNNTLRYNFKVELVKGRESLKHSVRQAQIKVALGGNATMLIWLGKNLLGQSDSPLNTDTENQILPWTPE